MKVEPESVELGQHVCSLDTTHVYHVSALTPSHLPILLSGYDAWVVPLSTAQRLLAAVTIR